MDGAADVELALEWLTTTQAAEILGVPPGRVRQFVERGFLPAERRCKRSHRYRRGQVDIGNARESRSCGGPLLPWDR
jgi:excisionase family DNA binding protein